MWDLPRQTGRYRWTTWPFRTVGRRTRCALVLVLGACPFLEPPEQAIPQTAPGNVGNVPADGISEDARLTLKALQALQSDRQLADVNVGVSVQYNVATLWGAVPSVELSARAETVVRGVLGIARVRNELRVESPEEPSQALLAAANPPTAPSRRQGRAAVPSSLAGGSCRAAGPTGSVSQPAPAVTLLPPVGFSPRITEPAHPGIALLRPEPESVPPGSAREVARHTSR